MLPTRPLPISMRSRYRIPPNVGEFWFFGLANVSPQSPPTVAVRLNVFDGADFRAVWAPDDVLPESVDKAATVTALGFIVNRLFDPTGQAAHSPKVVIHQEFTLTASGPQKIAEWQTARR
jgi:hypothetical protein